MTSVMINPRKSSAAHCDYTARLALSSILDDSGSMKTSVTTCSEVNESAPVADFPDVPSSSLPPAQASSSGHTPILLASADRCRLQAVYASMNARTASSSGPTAAPAASPGAPARTPRGPSPPGSTSTNPAASPAVPTAVSAAADSQGRAANASPCGAYNLKLHTSTPSAVRTMAARTGPASSSSPSTEEHRDVIRQQANHHHHHHHHHLTMQSAIPWKKRTLRPASINFHCIDDLVRPGDSYSRNTRGAINKRLIMQQHHHHVGSYHLQERPRPHLGSSSHRDPGPEEPRPTAGDATTRQPPAPCAAPDTSDEDIDVVDTVEIRLSPAPYTSSPSSSTTTFSPGAQPQSRTPPTHSPSTPPTPTTPDPPPTRDGGSVSPGGSEAAAASSSANSSTTGGGDLETADPNRLRKGRTIYKAQQVYILEQVFSRTHYPDPEVIETLSRELDISENKIKVWFQNKRARWRRRAAETGLPSQPIGFTLTGTPGLSPSWPHPTSLPAGVLMPQPVYTSPYGPPGGGGPPRPGFPPIGHFPGLSTPPLYLSFDSGMLHAAAKGMSPPAILPYGAYPMSVLPSHVWGESSKMPGT